MTGVVIEGGRVDCIFLLALDGLGWVSAAVGRGAIALVEVFDELVEMAEEWWSVSIRI